MSYTVIAILTITLYLISWGIITFRLFGNQLPWVPGRWIGLLAGFAGIQTHAALLYQGIITDLGLNLSFFNAFSLAAWIVILLLMLSSLSKPVENLGIFLLPVAALTIVLAIKYPALHLLGESAAWGMQIHVLVSLLSYSLLTLASVQAVLLAVQDHHLHHRHPGGFIRALPPLQTMETLLFEMIGTGFLLLSLALISGIAFLEDMFAQRLVHKTVLSFFAWIVFGTLLWGRFRYGWRGRTAITWTLSGFVVLMLAYFGSKAVIELILGN